MRSPAGAVERATLASRTAKHGPNHPETITARQDYRMARAEATIRDIVDAAPPLTDEQRGKVAALLRPASTAPTADLAETGGARA